MKPRAQRIHRLWTPRCRDAFEQRLQAHSVRSLMTFRFPAKPALHSLRRTLQTLTESIRNAARRQGHTGHAWIYVENGAEGGYHFHAAFTAPPGDALTKTLRNSWQRTTGQQDNSRKVFHITGEARDIEKLTAYSAKTQKGSFYTKTAAPEYRPELNFKPFRQLTFTGNTGYTSPPFIRSSDGHPSPIPAPLSPRNQAPVRNSWSHPPAINQGKMTVPNHFHAVIFPLSKASRRKSDNAKSRSGLDPATAPVICPSPARRNGLRPTSPASPGATKSPASRMPFPAPPTVPWTCIFSSPPPASGNLNWQPPRETDGRKSGGNKSFAQGNPPNCKASAWSLAPHPQRTRGIHRLLAPLVIHPILCASGYNHHYPQPPRKSAANHPAMKSLTLILALLAGLNHNNARAAAGDLDLNFGGTGKVITAIGSGNDFSRGLALQEDGKIVVAGTSWAGSNENFALVRYNSGGTLDLSFGGTGKVTTDFGGSYDHGYCMALQTDGKIIVAGSSYVAGSSEDFALARYNGDGSLDTSFNGSGKVTTAIGSGADSIQSVVIQSDGRIVVAGYSDNGSNMDFSVARYLPGGSLDTNFNGTGKVTTAIGSAGDYAYSVALQGDGKIVVAGNSFNNGTANDFAVVRYNSNGTLDTSFNGSGKVTTDFPGSAGPDDYGNSVAILSNGKILVGGTAFNASNNTDFALARYNSNGTLDTTFNGTGKLRTDFGVAYDHGNGMTVQKDGKILLVGDADIGGTGILALARYNPNGSLDGGFGSGGKVTTALGNLQDVGYSVAVQTDGNIVVAGYSWRGSGAATQYDIALARYESYADNDGDGVPDRFETGTGIFGSAEDTGTSPTNRDSDGDGLSDGEEVNTWHSNPNVTDSDADGFTDGFEVNTGFNPTSAQSTPDEFAALRPAREFRFGAANGISYRIEGSTDAQNWTTLETNIIGTGTEVTRFYVEEELGPRYFLRVRKN